MSQEHPPALSQDLHSMVEPLREVLALLSGKWSIDILVMVSRQPVRFTELERAIGGISRRMLTLTLRTLEREGLITRTVHTSVPPRVEYRPTTLLGELSEHLHTLAGWAMLRQGAIVAARTAYDGRPRTIAS